MNVDGSRQGDDLRDTGLQDSVSARHAGLGRSLRARLEGAVDRRPAAGGSSIVRSMLDNVDIDWIVSNRLTSFDDVCPLFDQVFAEPPYNWGQIQSERHREVFASRAQEPGFVLVVARAASVVVGAAYGFPADGRWWKDIHPASASEQDTFMVSGMAVDELWRRHGLGRQMLVQLLASCGKTRAAVAVLPGAIGAQSFYLSLGWRFVGRKNMPPTSPIEFLEIYSVKLANL